MVRPGAEEFLKEISQYYEVVVFTAALQEYADWVLDQIDPNKHVKARLYRQHALPYGTNFVKDLSRLGRDIRKVIIVDNVGENFQLQPENGILIRSWIDEPGDTALEELAPLLKGIILLTKPNIKFLEIVNKKVTDVRDALAKYSSQMSEFNDLAEQSNHFSLDKA